jgi:hypothetical protein
MKLEEIEIAIVYINLGRRPDRRKAVEEQLARLGWPAERVAAVDAAWVRDSRGFQNTRRYACSLSKRMAIRRGFQDSGVEAVLLLEDDVVFHPALLEKLGELDLPEDWGIFFLGCRHDQPPTPIAPGMVRCAQATSHMAMLVHKRAYAEVMRGLRGHARGAEGTITYSDAKLALLQGEIPTYAAYPNLAWQRPGYSDLGKSKVKYFHADGRQLKHAASMDAVDAAMARLTRGEFPLESKPEVAVADSADLPVVECVVVAWRSANLGQILDAFREQTIRCRVTVITSGRMAHGAPVPEEELARADRVFRTSQEFGAFNRYLPAFAYESDFVYLHDDDMLPGKRLIEHFLHTARMLGDFGVLGQLGRRFTDEGYNHRDVARTGVPEQVDCIVRGYFLPPRNLAAMLEAIYELKLRPGLDDLEDDLLLAWAMARKGLKCWLTPLDEDRETWMKKQELAPTDARSARGSHYVVRDQFVREHWRREWMSFSSPHQLS